MTDGIDLDDLLLAHAAGTLPAPLALLVRCHLRLRPESREQLRFYREIAGLCFERLEPAPVAVATREALLDALPDDPSAADPPVFRTADLPEPDRLSWRRLCDGVAEASLGVDGGGRLAARVLRIEPGHSPGRHGHEAREFVLVLAGAFRDEFGRYGPGDVVICDPRIEHAPVAEPGEPCLCLEVRERRPAPARP